MRLFLSIEIGDALRESLRETQAKLMALGGDIRWVEPENFHLTVLFLGDLGEERLAGIEDACAQVSSETFSFRVGLGRVSAFPKVAAKGNSKPIKTIIVEIESGKAEWESLVSRAEPWFTPMGVAKNGGLAAHVTLGRVRSEAGLESVSDVVRGGGIVCDGEQAAVGLTLVESFLSQSGALYQNRGFWPFKECGPEGPEKQEFSK